MIYPLRIPCRSATDLGVNLDLIKSTLRPGQISHVKPCFHALWRCLVKRKRFITNFLLSVLAIFILCLCASCQQGSELLFHLSFPEERSSEPLDGRLLLLISDNESDEPRFQVNRNDDTQLIFGTDVESLAPGEAATIDSGASGYPLANITDIPPGEYWVQGFLHRYETFHRADGHILKLPDGDRGDGQKWNIAPGNFYSVPQKMFIDPQKGQTLEISLTKEIPPISVPQDTKYVKHIRIESELVSKFWGRPMYLGAILLLPEGYEEHPKARYPIVIQQGHYQRTIRGWRKTPPLETFARSGDKPPGPKDPRRQDEGYNPFSLERAYQFYKDWTGPDFPRVIHVILQHSNPYYDDSYAINTANMGPYGDALTYELIPHIEREFRGIGQPWARTLYGCSTGGWESLGVQILYPDDYNGTWSSAPSPIDFRAYTSVNIYEEKNAYFLESAWKRTPRPGLRDQHGLLLSTLQEIHQLVQVLGTKGRSGHLRDAYQAAWGPVGEDGYTKPLWNPVTGEIDPSVADYARENYDLRYILERDWKTLGPKLKGKIHLHTGDMDNWYLPNSVYLMEAFLESTTDPYYGGEVGYGDRFPHCWGGGETSLSRGTLRQDLIGQMADHLIQTAPPGADTTSWRY